MYGNNREDNILGSETVSLVERSNIIKCPFLGGSTIGGSTIGGSTVHVLTKYSPRVVLHLLFPECLTKVPSTL